MKGIEELQKDWKTFLPAGATVPSPGEPLSCRGRVAQAPARRRVPRAARGKHRARRHERAQRGETRRRVRLRRLRPALFTSEMKYESGTGWPSFFTSIPGAFETKKDYFLIYPRTEYHCIRCGGHHGHLFDDGPPPTGQRWCNNGVALRFLPRQSA